MTFGCLLRALAGLAIPPRDPVARRTGGNVRPHGAQITFSPRRQPTRTFQPSRRHR